MFYKIKISHFIGIAVNAAFSHLLPIIKMCKMFLKSFEFISEDLIHDTAFAYEVMSKLYEYVKGNYQHITKIKYFSDGCVVQQKKLQKFLKPLPPL